MRCGLVAGEKKPHERGEGKNEGQGKSEGQGQGKKKNRGGSD